jgi:hypothetical protein
MVALDYYVTGPHVRRVSTTRAGTNDIREGLIRVRGRPGARPGSSTRGLGKLPAARLPEDGEAYGVADP